MSWELPKGFREILSDLDKFAMMLLRRGEYTEALWLHQTRYKLIVDRQQVEGRRLHKGSPLYMQGICFIARKEPLRAFPPIAQAFIEDLLSEGDSEIAKSFAAFALLSRVYAVPQELLEKLTSITLSKRGKSDWHPAKIFKEFIISTNLYDRDITDFIKGLPVFGFTKYSMDNIPGRRDTRVFVGGCYGNYIVLNRIENIILELKYQPIIANQFIPRPNASDRDHSFELLEKCGQAIFEISVPDGWGPEVEKANSLGLPLRLFYQGEEPSRLVSPMFKSYPNQGWKGFDDLKVKIAKFLDEVKYASS